MTDREESSSTDVIAASEAKGEARKAAPWVPPHRRKAPGAEASIDGLARSLATLELEPERRRASPPRRSRSPEPAEPPVGGAVMSAYGVDISEFAEERTEEEVIRCSVVVTGFPDAVPDFQRATLVKPLVDRGCNYQWVSDSEVLAVFASPSEAQRSVRLGVGRGGKGNLLTIVPVSQLSASRQKELLNVGVPVPARPRADTAAASRLIIGALGIRKPKTRESGGEQGAANGGSAGRRPARQHQAVRPPPNDAWDD